MRSVMAAASVGDDVFGDDPTVNELESATAALLGKEAAVFVPTGTMSNLIGLLAHCARGDEYIVGQNAHTYRYEGGGAAVLGSIQPQPIEFEPDGTLDISKIEAKIKPDDAHFARTRLISLENTHDGKPLPLDYPAKVRELADAHNLSLHLDGARLWNAAAAQQVAEAELVKHFDSVSVCLSKGLGAPLGSVFVGSSSLVSEARKWRKMVGGGMRQAGLAAAAGHHAITYHRNDLARTHVMAEQLGDVLENIDGIEVTAVNTNMVFADFTKYAGNAQEKLRANEITAFAHGPSRLVTHRDLPESTPVLVADALRSN